MEDKYELDPFREEESNTLEMTPPAGQPNMLNPGFTEGTGHFSNIIELNPETLLGLTPIDGIELKNRKKNILSVTELTRKGLMRLVQNLPSPDTSSRLQIGFIRHSPKLKQALANGELNPLIKALSESYREIYGHEPWNEYLCCSNPACAKTLSVEEVYGPKSNMMDLQTLESEIQIDPKDYKCPVDGAEMDFFYHPEQHLKALRNGFQQQVFATLLFEGDHLLMGFCLGWETTIEDGWKDKAVEGQGDAALPKLSYADYLAEVRQYINSDAQPADRAFNSAEWAIQRSAQKTGASLPILRAIYEQTLKSMQTNGEMIPVLGHSLEGSKALDIFKKIGFDAGAVIPESGEARVYSTLQRLINGIDQLSQKKKVQIIPIEQAELLENIPRDTLVIEMLCQEAVGSDESGNQKVHRYLSELAKMMRLKPVGDSVTHLSPLYGLSGWLPLENGAAIHLYAWDYQDGSHSPFLSIDISTPGVIANPEVVVTHAERFFRASGPSVTKKMQERENLDWKEIAPQIHRQRITITGETAHQLEPEAIKAYLRELAPHLDMTQLSDPLIVGNDGWMHWETSGTVLHWDQQRFTIDIYTCKPFDPQSALKFTVSQLRLEKYHHKNF